MSRAIWAMIGAAPVPVPPPMPQVTKTRSAPWRQRTTSSRFSSMAWRPISGRAPAPRPRVSFLPIWTLRSDLEVVSAWASVLTEMNSTPPRRSSIIRLTALPPPPPTPITFMRALWAPVSSSSKIMGGVLSGLSQKKSCSQRFTGPRYLSIDWERRRPGPERAPERYLAGPVEGQPREAPPAGATPRCRPGR